MGKKLRRLVNHRKYTDIEVHAKYGSELDNNKIRYDDSLQEQGKQASFHSLRKIQSSSFHEVSTSTRTSHFRQTGSALLRQFLSTLGPRAEVSLSRGWIRKGTSLQAEQSWTYEARAGISGDFEQVRGLICSRASRSGGRLQAGGWSRLLLGEEFAPGKARGQDHVLRLATTSCLCIWCQTAEVGADMDQMLAEISMDMEYMEQEEQIENVDKKRTLDLFTVCTRAELKEMVTTQEMLAIGQVGEGELELGVVERIDRGGRVKFSELMEVMIDGKQYCGGMNRQEIEKEILNCVRECHKKHGKTQRKFYVRGALWRFVLEGPGFTIFPDSKSASEDTKHAVGVVYRKQVISVFIGHLAVEEAFGSFFDLPDSFYIGFGEDAAGAQSILNNGELGKARYIGINELRSHIALRGGEEFVVELK